MLDEQTLKARAQKDLALIFSCLTTNTFTYNPEFSAKINADLEEAALVDVLREKIDHDPPTKNILRLTQQDEPVINKSFFSKNIRVIISGIGDSYWLENGVKSSVPGEVDTDHIRENTYASYILDYQDVMGNPVLVNYEDDNGMEIGASNQNPGRPDLMEKYRTNPGIIGS